MTVNFKGTRGTIPSTALRILSFLKELTVSFFEREKQLEYIYGEKKEEEKNRLIVL